MTDRELLERAAKAAGMADWIWSPSLWALCHFNKQMRSWYTDHWGDRLEWNPLEDDADRYRLAKKLGLVLDFDGGEVRWYVAGEDAPRVFRFSDFASEAHAIVSAAAATVQ